MRGNGRTNNKGKYTPKNPEKYIGNKNRIIWRSSWELQFFTWVDQNKNIISWSSESISIPYIKPTDGKIHKYYPDIFMTYKNKKGEIITEIVEIKPKVQTLKPTTIGKNKKTQLYEAVQYAVNVAKWKACQQFCDNHGIKFRLLCEDKMFK